MIDLDLIMHFVYKNGCSSKSESAQTKNIMDTAHPKGGGGGGGGGG